MSDNKKTWNRRPGESSKAYTAFCIYIDQSPQIRSMLKVEITTRDKLGKSTDGVRRPSKTVERWCKKWEWVKRALDHDTYLEQEARAITEEARIKEIIEYRKNLNTIAKQSLKNTHLMIKIQQSELQKRVDVIKKEKEDTPAELTISELSTLSRASSDMTNTATKTIERLNPEDFSIKTNVEVSWKAELEDKLPQGVDPEAFANQMLAIMQRQAVKNGDETNGNNSNGHD